MSSSGAFITGIDVGGGRHSQDVAPVDAELTLKQEHAQRVVAERDKEVEAFNPSDIDFDAIFDPSGPTNVPLSVPLKTFIAESVPIFGNVNDEFINHAWSQCFVDSPEVANMCKDLFWWLLRKVTEATKKRAEPMYDSATDSLPAQTEKSENQKNQNIDNLGADASSKDTKPNEEPEFEENPFDPNFEEDEEDLAWIRSLDRANRAYERAAESPLTAAFRAQEAKRAPPPPQIEDLVIERLSENYLSLFRKTMYNIEAFCKADKSTDELGDGLLPKAVRKGVTLRAMSFRGRRACDRILGAFPDAFAQTTVRAVHRAAPRIVESFGIERLRACASDVMNVCINGMRETKTHTGHWSVLGLGAILSSATAPVHVKLPMAGIKKRTLGLHKELAILSKKLDNDICTDEAVQKSSRPSTMSMASRSGAVSPRRNLSSLNIDGSSPNSNGVSDGNTGNQDENSLNESRRFNNQRESESMQLQQNRIVTKTRFVLGHSHFIGKLVERNNRMSSLRKHELTITLTTSSERPDLVPSLSASASGYPLRTGKDLFGWVAKESVSQKDSIMSGQDILSDRNFSKDHREEGPLRKNKQTVTVSMALAASRKRALKILQKSKRAAIQAKNSVKKIRHRQKIDLDGIAKEARRVRRGDSVNEVANNLANLSNNPNKKL